ncbi:hypothetical protein [Paraglaciecola sp.]|uniref:hypothetical protein n=1 Tax=Paraglaciecola sp. TaxID=1920173 RepID=UPI0030F443D2
MFSYRHRYATLLNYAIFQSLNVQRTGSAKARHYRNSTIGTIESLFARFTVLSLKNRPAEEVRVTFRRQDAGIYRSVLTIINAPSG